MGCRNAPGASTPVSLMLAPKSPAMPALAPAPADDEALALEAEVSAAADRVGALRATMREQLAQKLAQKLAETRPSAEVGEGDDGDARRCTPEAHPLFEPASAAWDVETLRQQLDASGAQIPALR